MKAFEIVEIGSINTLLGIPKVSKGERKPITTVMLNDLWVLGKDIEQMPTAFAPHTTHPTPLFK